MLFCSFELTAPSTRAMGKAWKRACLSTVDTDSCVIIIIFSNSCIISSDRMDGEQKGLIYNCFAVDLTCILCKSG